MLEIGRLATPRGVALKNMPASRLLGWVNLDVPSAAEPIIAENRQALQTSEPRRFRCDAWGRREALTFFTGDWYHHGHALVD